jgi:hypothetical protein
MLPNPYDDPKFFEHKTAAEVAEQTILRRLVAEFFAATKRMRPEGTNQVWDFEQKCIGDLSTWEWPGSDPEQQRRVKDLAASYLSEFLAPIHNQ